MIETRRLKNVVIFVQTILSYCFIYNIIVVKNLHNSEILRNKKGKMLNAFYVN